MAKLPVNFLLYALYAASAGLIGGIGYTFYTTFKLKERYGDVAYRREVNALVDQQIKLGREAQPERLSWRYDAGVLEWWKQFHNVNVLGKLPPEPVPDQPKVETTAPPPTQTPVDDLIVVESLLLEKSEAKDRATHLIVRYKPGVTVQPPPEAVPVPSTAASGKGAAWSPGDTPRAPSGPATPAPSTMPLAAGGQVELRQFVHIDETLWPPHHNLRLVRISDDAQSAFFLREDASVERASWKEEEIFKNELELDAEVVKTLRGDQRRAREGAGNGDGQATPPPLTEVTQWRDVATTSEVAPGQIHVSRRDHDYVRDNVEKVFNEEAAVSSYKARVGNYEGLKIDRLSSRLAQFGIQPGDVILSINGEKVKQKAQAYSVAKRQYEAGKRTFVVEVLSGRGTGVETKTITVPKN
jgi:hypothetical protein